jgi:hypothetical protein
MAATLVQSHVPTMYGICGNVKCHNSKIVTIVEPVEIPLKIGTMSATCCLVICKTCKNYAPKTPIKLTHKDEYQTIVTAIETNRARTVGNCMICHTDEFEAKSFSVTHRRANRLNLSEKAVVETKEFATVNLCTHCASSNRVF